MQAYLKQFIKRITVVIKRAGGHRRINNTTGDYDGRIRFNKFSGQEPAPKRIFECPQVPVSVLR